MNQRGFVHIVAVIAISLISILMLTVAVVTERGSRDIEVVAVQPNIKDSTIVIPEAEKVDYAIYQNDTFGYRFYYPKELAIKDYSDNRSSMFLGNVINSIGVKQADGFMYIIVDQANLSESELKDYLYESESIDISSWEEFQVGHIIGRHASVEVGTTMRHYYLIPRGNIFTVVTANTSLQEEEDVIYRFEVYSEIKPSVLVNEATQPLNTNEKINTAAGSTSYRESQELIDEALNGTWQKYISAGGEYSYEYPGNWTLEAGSTHIYSYDRKVAQSSDLVVGDDGTSPWSSHITKQGMSVGIEAWEFEPPSTWWDPETFQSQGVISGVNGYVALDKWSIAKRESYHTQIGFIKDGRWFMLDGWANVENHQQLEQIFLRIAESITVMTPGYAASIPQYKDWDQYYSDFRSVIINFYHPASWQIGRDTRIFLGDTENLKKNHARQIEFIVKPYDLSSPLFDQCKAIAWANVSVKSLSTTETISVSGIEAEYLIGNNGTTDVAAYTCFPIFDDQMIVYYTNFEFYDDLLGVYLEIRDTIQFPFLK
ncbi:MAG: hypothetical protein HZC01_00685 [Candidatus Kerfeldbacteria bacterium]|nr:hypothetical protein [Candidatus Kerfeldbacteria bacterium]